MPFLIGLTIWSLVITCIYCYFLAYERKLLYKKEVEHTKCLEDKLQEQQQENAKLLEEKLKEQQEHIKCLKEILQEVQKKVLYLESHLPPKRIYIYS